LRFRLAGVGRRIAAAGLIAAFMASLATLMPQAAFAQAAGDTAPSTYTINAGDEIEVYVWGEERLQRVLHVLPDGTVGFPLVGQLHVQGMLPQAVERVISEKLKPQYRGEVPNVTVSVRAPAGLQFSVMGKVRSPGSFTPGRYINVIDAISLAGGPAEFANLDNVSIIRRQGDHQVTLRVKLSPVFKGNAPGTIDKGTAVPLVPGDIVIVP
jgi:polysaccharide biosynthesis/export protein